MKQKTQNILLLIIFLTITTSQPCPADQLTRKNGRWWLQKYGEITDPQHKLKIKANKILDRLWQTLQPSPMSKPKLGIIPSDQDRFLKAGAFVTVDNWIILLESLFDITHQDRAIDNKPGDARLAFVLSHELGHIILNHQKALSMQLRFDPSLSRAEAEDSMELETEADRFAIFTVSKAGYSPTPVIGRQESDFFHHYYKHVRNKYLDISLGQNIKQRSNSMRKKLTAFSEKIKLFEEGVKSYQAGQFEEAAHSFKSFSDYYDGREVLNNLGLSYYRLSNQQITGCDQPQYKVITATFLEKNTRAKQLIPEDIRIGADLFMRCLIDQEYRFQIEKTARTLTKIQKNHPRYRPALINLSALYITTGKYNPAIKTAKKVLRLSPNNAYAQINLALALFLKNQENKKSALNILQKIPASTEVNRIIQYNLALISAANNPFYK